MTAEERQEETGKMIRLEKATIGVNVIAGIALTVLIGLVADVRASIATLNVRVETAIRDVAVLQSQRLEERTRSLEAIASKCAQKLDTLERDIERVDKEGSVRWRNSGTTPAGGSR